MEKRYLLAAGFDPVPVEASSIPASPAVITWFESFDHVERIAPSRLSQVDRTLPAGMFGPQEPATGEWIVQLSNEASDRIRRIDEAKPLLDQIGVEFTLISGLGAEGWLLVRGQSATREQIESSLRDNANVASYSLNQLLEGQARLPDDPQFVGGLLPGLDAIDVARAWEDAIGSLSNVVGVVDSGIDPTHPDLYLNIWVNQGELPRRFLDNPADALVDIDGDDLITFYDLNNVTRSNVAPFSLTFGGWDNGPNAGFVRDLNSNGRIDAHDLLQDPNWADGRDNDGNGFFDDFFGVNFRAGADDPFAENNPDDELGHGTHVSGTIGAIGGNGRGVVGVNWQTSLMSLRILDNNNQGDSGAAIRAVNYARQMREQYRVNDQGRVTRGAMVRVLNNSWGQPGGFEQSLEAAINLIADEGVLFVAAAGNGNILGQGVDNDRTPFYPASYEAPNLIAVAASDADGRLATFSNFGADSVDVVAPGVGIRSTVPGGGYQSANGTSMATPHVSGTAALIWSFLPEATANEVRQAILDSVTPIAQVDVVSTGGRVSAGNAIPTGVFAPATRLVSHQDVTTAGGTSTEFRVEYRHSSGIDPTTIGDDDLIVTRSWGSSPPVSPTLKPGSLVESIDGKSIFASYEYAAPGTASFASFRDPIVDYDSLTYEVFENSQRVDIAFDTGSASEIVVNNQNGLFERGLFVTVNTTWADELVVDLVGPNDVRVELADLKSAGGDFKNTIFRDDADRSILTGSPPFTGAFRPQQSLSSLGVTDPNGTWSLQVFHECDPDDVFCDAFFYDGAAIEGWSIHLPQTITRLTSEVLVSDVSQLQSDFTVSLDTSFADYNNATATLIAPDGRRVVLFEGHTADYVGNVRTTFDDAASGPVADLSQPLNGRFQPQEPLSSLAASNPNGVWKLEWTGDFDVVSRMPELRWSLDFAGSWDVLDYGDYVISTIPGSIAANDGSRAGDQRDVGAFSVQIDDPSVFYVNQRSDSLAPGSLRSAIVGANAMAPQRGVIILDPGTYSLAIPAVADPASTFPAPDPDHIARRVEGAVWSNETTGDLDITGNVAIFGDTNNETIVDAEGVDRAFKVHPNAAFDLHRVTVQGGLASASQAGGGGILSAGDLGLHQVIVRDNVALEGSHIAPSYGGGVAVWDGTASISESWIAGNQADRGSGLFFAGDSSATIRASTISGHSEVGLMSLSTGNIEIINSTFSGNAGSGGAILVGVTGDAGFETFADLDPAMSSSGRFVVFASNLKDLVPGDLGSEGFSPSGRESTIDVFLFDRVANTIERLSVNANGEPGNDASSEPAISSDGRFVAFRSEASNLVPNDTNGHDDIFVVDRQTGLIERVNVTLDGTEANANSFAPSISDDGRIVAFYTSAGNLVPDDNNSDFDVFVVDRDTGILERISTHNDGTEGDDGSFHPVVSGDGRFVSFDSDAANLVDGDANSSRDVFLYDRQSDSLRRISVNAEGTEGNNSSEGAAMSADSRFLVFESTARNLVPEDTSSDWDIYVYDQATQTIELVSKRADGVKADSTSFNPAISADGRFVAFASSANNLVTDGLNSSVTNIFVVDRTDQSIELITVDANADSILPAISADGRFVSFQSRASNLVAGDDNNTKDVFLFDRLLGTMKRLRRDLGGVTLSNSSIFFTSESESAVTGRVFVNNSLFGGNVVASEVTGGVGTDEASAILLDTQLPLVGPLTRLSTLPPVHPLLFGNAGIDAADFESSQAYDQLGRPRLAPDLGAFEATQASVSGVVYADLNRNGVRDPGEGIINGVPVEMRDANGQLLSLQTPTASDPGRFAFDALHADAYQFSLVIPPGWSPYRPTPVIARSPAAEPNGISELPSLSGDGRFVAFQSSATNLVANDGGGFDDVFVFDRIERSVKQLTVGGFLGLFDANGDSGNASFSADGRFVAFDSAADNIVSNDTNVDADIFLVDRESNSGTRVSLTSSGAQANNASFEPSLSANGRFVAFYSLASNLVPGDTNGFRDIFVRDTETSSIERISVAADGTQGSGNSYDPSISGSGRFVAFYSSASTLVADDTNGNADIFLVDRQTESIERISVSNLGVEANGESFDPAISGDGRFVVFRSLASNLVPGDTNNSADIFFYDRQARTVERVSVNVDGEEGNSGSFRPSISADGRFVVFDSDASNLVADDTNNVSDVFVYDRLTKQIARVSVDADGNQANGASEAAVISANGETIAFESTASNLVPSDGNARQDIVVVSNPFSQPTRGVTLRVGEVITDLNLGLVADPGTISGRVFQDVVANGVYDAGEPAFGAVTVYLDINTNGRLDDGEPTQITDASGGYAFLDIPSHRPYSVAIERPVGTEQVNPPSTDRFAWSLFLPAAGTVNERDFALQPIDSTGQSSASAVSGRLFEDRNDNGVYDDGIDIPIVGREVYLDASNFGVRDTNEPREVTGVDGRFAFDGLSARNVAVTAVNDPTMVHVTPLGSEFRLQRYPLFAELQPFGNPQAIAAADFNDDGLLDVAVALGEANKLSLRMNDGQGGFLSDEIDVDLGDAGAGPTSIVVGQFNTDPRVDVALTANFTGRVTILLDFDPTTSTFASQQAVQVGDEPLDLASGLFDGDTFVDLVVVNEADNTLQLLRNDGNGVFTVEAPVGTGGLQAVSIVTGDFNGDGHLDVAVSHAAPRVTTTPFGGVTVIQGDGQGGLVLGAEYYEVGALPIDSATADFNRDGRPDIAVANFSSNSISILLATADGHLRLQPSVLGTASGAFDITVADIDNDNDVDVIASNLRDRNVSIFRNVGVEQTSGNVRFEPLENIGLGQFSLAQRMPLLAANIDNDTSGPGGSGTIDIVTVPQRTDMLHVLSNHLIDGAHRVALTGLNTVAGLDFIVKPAVLPPTFDAVPDPPPIVQDAAVQSVVITGVQSFRPTGPPLRFQVVSSNANLIASPTISYSVSNALATVRYEPVRGASGTATLTVEAIDAGADETFDTADDGVFRRSFVVTVLPNNGPRAVEFLTATIVDAATHTRTPIVVTSASVGTIDVMLDLNQDGDWDDSGEWIVTGAEVAIGNNLLALEIPAGTSPGQTYLRIRQNVDGQAPVVSDYGVFLADSSIPVTLDLDLSRIGPLRWESDGQNVRLQSSTAILFTSPQSAVESFVFRGPGAQPTVRVNGDALIGSIDLDPSGSEDRLRLGGLDAVLDLTNVPNRGLSGIDRIDLTGGGANQVTLNVESIVEISGSDSLHLMLDPEDRVHLQAGWQYDATSIVGDVVVHTFAQQGVKLHFETARFLTNPLYPFDVDRSGDISAVDALQVVNELGRRSFSDRNSNPPGQYLAPSQLDAGQFRFLDVNGDGVVTALDALQVVNELSRRATATTASESEGPSPDLVDAVLIGWLDDE